MKVNEFDELGNFPMNLTIECTSKSSSIMYVAGDVATKPTNQDECGGVEIPAEKFKARKPRMRPKRMPRLKSLGDGNTKTSSQDAKLSACREATRHRCVSLTEELPKIS